MGLKFGKGRGYPNNTACYIADVFLHLKQLDSCWYYLDQSALLYQKNGGIFHKSPIQADDIYRQHYYDVRRRYSEATGSLPDAYHFTDSVQLYQQRIDKRARTKAAILAEQRLMMQQHQDELDQLEQTSLLTPASGSAVCVGGSVSVPVGVTGTGPLNYQWYKGVTSITSQTTATLSLSNVTSNDTDSYSLVVTGACNSLTTKIFSLTVNALPSVTVVSPVSATLTCASPVLTLTTQNSATAFVWSNGGSTTESLSVSQTGVYSVTVTDGNGCTAVSNSLTQRWRWHAHFTNWVN